jgi:hypothetical protein
VAKMSEGGHILGLMLTHCRDKYYSSKGVVFH